MKKLLLTIVLAVAITNVFGTTYYWVGGSTGSWATNSNWNTTLGGGGSSRTPATSDVLVFDFANRGNGAGAGTAITVSDVSNETISSLQIISSSGGNTRGLSTVTFSGATTTLTLTGDLVIGFYASSNNNCKLVDGGNSIIVGGNFTTVNAQTASSTYHTGNGKIVFTNSSATLASGATGGNINFQNVEIGDGTNSANLTIGAAFQINGNLHINSNATLSNNNKSFILNSANGIGGTISGSGTIIATSTSGTFYIQGTAGTEQQTVGTINFNTASAANSTINSLQLKRPNSTVTIGTANSNTLTVSGTITLDAGTINDGGNTIVVKGSTIIAVTATPGAGIHTGTGKIQASRTNAGPLLVSAGKTVSLGNIEIASTSGAVTYAVGSGTNLTINGTLTLSKSGSVVNAGGSTITFQNAHQPIVLNAGTMTTDANTILNFGSSGNTGGSSFTIPNGLFTSAPTVGTLNVTRDNVLTLNNQALTASVININAGSKLSLGAGITTANLNIKSDVSGGTATLLDNGFAVTATNISVNQYLGTSRNWYISSPVSNAKAPAGFTYYQRDVAGSSWTSQPFAAASTFEKGRGYIAMPGATGATMTFTTETGGTLNTGNVDVTLSAAGFNLIGNPYPSHLAWTPAFVDDAANAAKIDPTIWVRTNSGSSNTGGWSFLTYNAHSGEAAPSTSILTGGVIPPMQAFWVKAKSASTLTLDSKLTRSHQSSNPLKAPASKNNERQRVRLQINNGTTTDEALIYFDGAASNDFDPYDSPKFADSNSVTQIYTTAGTEKLVINGMNSIPLDQPIALGLVPGNAASFSIRANEISNIPADVKLILKDNVTQVETDLTDGSAVYQFSAETTNPDRFSVIFRSSSTTTALNNSNVSGTQMYWNNEQGLTFKTNDEKLVGSTLTVYNSLGQQLLSKKIAGTTMNINFSCAPDMYFVKINNVTTKVIVK